MSVVFDGAKLAVQLRELAVGIRNNAVQALRSAIQAAEADAKSTTLYNDRSGTLRQNTRGAVDGLEGELRADTKYAKFVENGTKPHVIEAKGGGTLRFVVNGEVRFARSVNHPGTAERPFMQHARDTGDKVLDHGADYFTDYAISHFNSQG